MRAECVSTNLLIIRNIYITNDTFLHNRKKFCDEVFNMEYTRKNRRDLTRRDRARNRSERGRDTPFGEKPSLRTRRRERSESSARAREIRYRERRYEARGSERRRKATVSRNVNRRTPSCLPGHRCTPLLRSPPSRSSSSDAGADTVSLAQRGPSRAFLSLSIESVLLPSRHCFVD